jgi:hypothetical protein
MGGVLNAELVARAFAVARPAIEATMATVAASRRSLTVVVTAVEPINPRSDGPHGFRDACYLIETIGDASLSPYPNLEIALKKAELSARAGLPTSRLPPQYLRAGDTVYWGSAVLDGIVAACAGMEAHHDEMFAYWIAATVQAVAKEAFVDYLAKKPGASFLE